MNPTTKLVTDMVAYVTIYYLISDLRETYYWFIDRMQACYVNTTHPDFLNGHKVVLLELAL